MNYRATFSDYQLLNPNDATNAPAQTDATATDDTTNTDKSKNVQPPQAVLNLFSLGFADKAEKPTRNGPVETTVVPSAAAQANYGNLKTDETLSVPPPAPAAAPVASSHTTAPRAPSDVITNRAGVTQIAERTAPRDVSNIIKAGDVVYFDAIGSHTHGHAEMCIGHDKNGNAMFASDAAQGTNFYANSVFMGGTYSIYRNQNPEFNAALAVARLRERTDGKDYGGECAAEVRQAMEQGLGHGLGAHPGDAKGYNRSGTMEHNDFAVVARGGPGGLNASTHLASAATTAPKGVRFNPNA